jgi:hypothetical protein
MTATQHGMPGEWAKVRGTVLSLWPLFLCFIALGAFGAALVLGRHLPLFAGLLVVSLMLTVVFWWKGLRRVESFFKGARGEEHVAGLLATLPADYHVFHDFAAGGYHVDHVVVGPTGIFSVETKSWRGSVTVEDDDILVNGRLPDRAPLVQATREAAAVQAALRRAGWTTGDVKPVVCFASDTFADGQRTIGTVMVLNAAGATAWIVECPKVLTADDVERVAQLMETCV